jgi:hypothetical protein
MISIIVRFITLSTIIIHMIIFKRGTTINIRNIVLEENPKINGQCRVYALQNTLYCVDATTPPAGLNPRAHHKQPGRALWLGLVIYL